MNTLTKSMLRGCSGETQRATRKRTILQLIFLFSHSHGQLRDVQDPFCEHTYTCVCIHSHRHILTLVITIVPEAHSGEVRLEQGWLALIRIDECWWSDISIETTVNGLLRKHISFLREQGCHLRKHWGWPLWGLFALTWQSKLLLKSFWMF